MRERLIEIISDAVVRCRWLEINTGDFLSPVEAASIIADQLISSGATLVPEGAIVLTKAEIEALNKYEEARKNEAN